MCRRFTFPVSSVLVVLAKCACGSSEAYQVHVWCVSVNGIGAAGGTAVAEALKVNTSVQKINLRREWCW